MPLVSPVDSSTWIGQVIQQERVAAGKQIYSRHTVANIIVSYFTEATKEEDKVGNTSKCFLVSNLPCPLVLACCGCVGDCC